MGFGAAQPPAPLQVDGPRAPAALHDALAQIVVAVGYTQVLRFVALQVPPHEVPAPAHGVLGVVTALHVPGLAALTHDSHWPSHATLQQTPSEPHTPLEHSVAAAHVVPLAFVDAPPLPLAPAALEPPGPPLPAPLSPPLPLPPAPLPPPASPADAPPPYSSPPVDEASPTLSSPAMACPERPRLPLTPAVPPLPSPASPPGFGSANWRPALVQDTTSDREARTLIDAAKARCI